MSRSLRTMIALNAIAFITLGFVLYSTLNTKTYVVKVDTAQVFTDTKFYFVATEERNLLGQSLSKRPAPNWLLLEEAKTFVDEHEYDGKRPIDWSRKKLPHTATIIEIKKEEFSTVVWITWSVNLSSNTETTVEKNKWRVPVIFSKQAPLRKIQVGQSFTTTGARDFHKQVVLSE